MKCSICNSINSNFLGTKNSFLIIQCQDCLTIYVERDKDSDKEFDYSNYYSEENLSIPDFVYDTYRNIIKNFESYRNNNRLLDIGCGAGTLLEIGKEMDWKVFGVEVSKPAAEHLKKKDFDVFQGTLQEANFPDNYFDIVTCTEVIEHLKNPKEVLKEIARILDRRGILWMTTPHSQGLSRKLLGSKWSAIAPPEHLNLFSVKSLKIALEDVGFKDCRFVSSGFNPFEIYQHLRGKKTENNLQSAKNSKEKRLSPGFERVSLGYKLNNWFMSGKNKQKMKDSINFLLNTTNLGDTIKVWASIE